MASEYFDFKRFRVYHDCCAQKVGTDGVVLGAWADVECSRHILDIGTGSGLIALMVAQRVPHAMVVGVDIDADAVEQASQNVLASPFAGQITICQCDVRNYLSEVAFDHIICNPPFYTEDTLPPDTARALARNASCLPFEDLVSAAARLLSLGGKFSVMLPVACRDAFTVLCETQALHVVRECTVQTVARKAPKRILITYSNVRVECVVKESIILQEGNEKSEAYKSLAREFYL